MNILTTVRFPPGTIRLDDQPILSTILSYVILNQFHRRSIPDTSVYHITLSLAIHHECLPIAESLDSNPSSGPIEAQWRSESLHFRLYFAFIITFMANLMFALLFYGCAQMEIEHLQDNIHLSSSLGALGFRKLCDFKLVIFYLEPCMSSKR